MCVAYLNLTCTISRRQYEFQIVPMSWRHTNRHSQMSMVTIKEHLWEFSCSDVWYQAANSNIFDPKVQKNWKKKLKGLKLKIKYLYNFCQKTHINNFKISPTCQIVFPPSVFRGQANIEPFYRNYYGVRRRTVFSHNWNKFGPLKCKTVWRSAFRSRRPPSFRRFFCRESALSLLWFISSIATAFHKKCQFLPSVVQLSPRLSFFPLFTNECAFHFIQTLHLMICHTFWINWSEDKTLTFSNMTVNEVFLRHKAKCRLVRMCSRKFGEVWVRGVWPDFLCPI